MKTPLLTRLKQLESVPVEEGIRRLRLAITCFDDGDHQYHSWLLSACHWLRTLLETDSLFGRRTEIQSSPALVAEAVRDYWRAHFTEAEPSGFPAVASTREDQASQRY